MSSTSWRDSLKQTQKSLSQSREHLARVAVVGIGNEMRGDDAAGVVIARTLKRRLAHKENILVIEGEHAPENHTGPLRRFAPDLVILVDTAQMQQPPGTVRWLVWQETSGLSASTHTMPPYMLARYLSAELGCEVALIGIQPAQLTISEAVSAPVQKAVIEIVALLSAAL